MIPLEQAWSKLLIAETRRRLFDESIPRIEICLDMLSEEQVWWRPYPDANSVGNLILHLEGNARQWIHAGLLHHEDLRDRGAEFEAGRETADKAELKARLQELHKMLDQDLNLVLPENLLDGHDVQVYRETGISILVHVVEHFSYHTGQIAYITKMLTERDTGFYEGEEL